MARRNYRCERFEVNLPNGLKGTVQLRVDLPGLAQDLGWKAYFNVGKRSTLKNGIVDVKICGPGAVSGTRQD